MEIRQKEMAQYGVEKEKNGIKKSFKIDESEKAVREKYVNVLIIERNSEKEKGIGKRKDKKEEENKIRRIRTEEEMWRHKINIEKRERIDKIVEMDRGSSYLLGEIRRKEIMKEEERKKKWKTKR